MKYFALPMILFLLAVTVAFAKGLPEKAIVTGDNFSIEVTEFELLKHLSMTGLMDIFSEIDEPTQRGIGYEIIRGAVRDNQFIPFDKVIYYPDSSSGAVIYYFGMVDEAGERIGLSEYDRRWYPALEDGDATMNQILADVQVDLAISSGSNTLNNRVLQVALRLVQLLVN